MDMFHQCFYRDLETLDLVQKLDLIQSGRSIIGGNPRCVVQMVIGWNIDVFTGPYGENSVFV